MLEIQIFPLVSNAVLPAPAPAITRRQIPPGYGVQEHCLPFTAATALGFLILSPICFGICPREKVPPDGHAFRSPLDRPDDNGDFFDERVFYVKDDPNCGFVRNAFTLDAIDIIDSRKSSSHPVSPGLSFFDREDQGDLFKIHLPYIWRTPSEIDTLFVPGINRPANGLTILSGLVETDWYASPVNLVARKPPDKQSIHVAVGESIAQVIFVPRGYRRPVLNVLARHARMARDLQRGLLEWYRQHRKDRSAYKKIARSQEGRG
jgi:hypothetical protein